MIRQVGQRRFIEVFFRGPVFLCGLVALLGVDGALFRLEIVCF